jgi:hypothetical protein
MFLVKLGKSLVGGRGQNTYTWYVDQWLKYIILLIHVVCEPMVEIYYSSYSKYYVAVVTMATYVVVIVIAPDVQLTNTSVWVAYDNNSYITNACRKLTLFPTSKCDEYFSRTYMQYSRS